MFPCAHFLIVGLPGAFGEGSNEGCACAKRLMASVTWKHRCISAIPVGAPDAKTPSRHPLMPRQWGRQFYQRVFAALGLGLVAGEVGGPVPGMKFLEIDAGVGHALSVIGDLVIACEEVVASGKDAQGLSTAMQRWSWFGGHPARSPRKPHLVKVCAEFGTQLHAFVRTAASEAAEDASSQLSSLADGSPRAPELPGDVAQHFPAEVLSLLQQSPTTGVLSGPSSPMNENQLGVALNAVADNDDDKLTAHLPPALRRAHEEVTTEVQLPKPAGP